MSNQELYTKATDLKQLKLMKEQLEGEIKELEDSIKAHMTENSLDTVVTTDVKIMWKDVTSSRLDTKALTNYLGKDCLADFYITTTTKRFVVA